MDPEEFNTRVHKIKVSGIVDCLVSEIKGAAPRELEELLAASISNYEENLRNPGIPTGESLFWFWRRKVLEREVFRSRVAGSVRRFGVSYVWANCKRVAEAVIPVSAVKKVDYGYFVGGKFYSAEEIVEIRSIRMLKGYRELENIKSTRRFRKLVICGATKEIKGMDFRALEEAVSEIRVFYHEALGDRAYPVADLLTLRLRGRIFERELFKRRVLDSLVKHRVAYVLAGSKLIPESIIPADLVTRAEDHFLVGGRRYELGDIKVIKNRHGLKRYLFGVSG